MKLSSAFYFVRRGSLAAALVGLITAHTAHAASLTWDGNGSQGGSGTWNTNNTANWWNGTVDVVWPALGGTNDDAVFGGTAGTVTISTVTANDLTFNTTGYTLSSGTLTLNGTTPTITAGSGISTAISSTIAGTVGLTKAGLGTLTLSGTNTYSGVTRITGGSVVITGDSNLGSAPGIATAGSLVLDGGTLSTSGTFSLNANRGIVVGPSSGQGDGTISVTSGELTYNGIITSNGASGTGNLVKSGAGTLTLGGSNTFTGNTTISSGTLKIASITAIPSGTGKGDLSIAGTLDLNGYGITLNGLSGAGSITSSAAGTINLTVGGNNKGGTYTGVLGNGSGTVGLTKIGTGTLVLGGNNTFTGGVIINAGTLQLGSTTGLGAATNTVTFGASAPATTKLQLNGNSITIGGLATNTTPGTVLVENANAGAATLTINQSATTTFAGVLQDGTGGGAMSLTKSGTGVLTLSGTNTFTGSTTISGGTLALSGGSAIADSAAVSLADTSGAILLLNANETIGSLSGGGATGGNVNLQGFTLTTGGATNYAGTISGSGSLIKTGTGVFTLSRGNTYAGSTSIKNGQIALGIDNALTTSTVLTLGDGTTNTSGVLKLNNYQQTLAGLTTAGNGSADGIGNRVINGSATTKTLTLNNTNNYSFSGILGGSTSDENNFNLVKSGTGTLTLSGTNTYSGTTTINAGTVSVGNISNGLGSGASAIALSGGTLSYSGNNANFTRGFTISTSGGQIDTTTAGQTLTLNTGGVAITTTGNFTVGGTGNTTISSNITGASGGILTKTGTGTLTLSGTNSYSGVTNIKNGTIALGVNNGVNQSATVTLGDATANTNGVLRLNGYAQTVSGLTITGAGTGNRVTGGSATLSNLTINNSGGVAFGGILGGTGTDENNLALIKSGAGVLTLSGTNTYTGGTTLSAGTLAIAASSNLGAGTLSIGAGTLQITNNIAASARAINLTDATSAISVDTGMSYTSSGSITGTGALNATGAGTLVVSGTSNDYSGGTNIKNGGITLGANNALPIGTLVTLGNLTVSGKLTLNGYNQTVSGLLMSGTGTTNRVINGKSTAVTFTINNSADSSFAGILGGATANENNFGLTKTGSGKLTLSGVNTYTGNTVISTGTLALGSASVSIPTGASAGNVQVDGTLDVNGQSPTINGLSGSGIILNNGATGKTISVGNNDQTSTFTGVIQDGTGTIALTKVGAGVLTLSNANTYSGNTTVTLGTLKIGNASAIPSGTGKGNVALTGSLDLNGNSVTLNGLSGAGGISSSVAGTMTLSVGANDQTSSYTGVIANGTATSLGLTKVGTGTLTISGNSTYSGDTTISAGTLKLNGTAAIPSGASKGNLSIASGAFLDMNNRSQTINGLTGSGTITTNSATAVTLTVGGNNQTSTFDGVIQNGSGTVALLKTGSGTLTLAGNNTFTGGVTINTTGVLQLANAGAINASGVNTVTFGSGASAATKLQLNGNSVTIAGLQTNATTAGSPIVENANAASSTLTINNSSNFTYASAINDGTGGGALALVKTGSGTQTLTGTSTYTGGTTISGGILAISKDAALGATSGLLTIGSGKLEATATISSTTRNIAVTSASSAIIVDPGFTYTEAGVISGSGTLNKEGTGILQISGTANTYSGGTVVTAGLLDVTATSGTPLGQDINTNNITVNAGGNLSLSNTSNKGANQSITVNSSSSALGGIGFSNTGLTLAQLAGMFTDSTGSYGGVLSVNNGISYSSNINLTSFGSGAGQGYWFLGSASTGTVSNITIGAGSTYRLGGGGGTLTLSGANLLTGNNDVLVGSGLTNGNGMVIANVAENYTGKTTVTGGAIYSIGLDTSLGAVPGGATPGKVTLDNGTLQARAAMTISANRGFAVGPASGSGSGTIDTNGNAVSYGGIIANNGSGTGGLIKIGAGTLTLTGNQNTYTGATTINNGTINFSGINDLGAGTAINFGTGTTGGTLQYASGNTADITARTVTFGTSGGTIDTNGNNVSFANPTFGTGSFSKIGTGTLTLNAVNAMGNITIGAGTLKLGVANAIPVTSSLTLNGGASSAGNLDINGFDTTVMNLAGTTNTVLGKVINSAVGTAKALTVNSNANTTFAGILADNTGTGGTLALVKTGASTLTLSGPNTYSGGTTISTGTLTVTGDSALGTVPGTATPGSITIASGASLGTVTNSFEINANRGIAINGNTAASVAVGTGLTLTYNGIIANTGGTTGGLTKTNTTGTLVLGGTNTYAGDTTVAGGTLRVANNTAIPSGAGKGNVSLTGTLNLNGNAITVNGLTGAGSVTSSVAGAAGITVGSNNQTSSFAGTIVNGSGTVSLGKTGTGTLTLSGTNTYTGGTTISQGVLSIAADANIGGVPGVATPGNIVINGGSLSTSASFTLNANRGIAVGPASGAGTGTLDAAAGTTLTYNGIVADNGAGSGGLTKSNTTGTLVLGGTNTYSGDTTVLGGTLKLGNVAAIPSGSGKGNLALTGTLDLNNLSPTVNGISGTGTVTNNLTGTATFTVGGNGATSSFGGIIQDGNGTVALTKTGTGTLSLSAANTYSGNTTIDAGGVLEATISTAIPSGLGKGNVIVNGTLDLDTSLTLNGLSGSGTISTDTASAIVLTAGANDQTSNFAGNIVNGGGGGTVGLTKTGTGTLTLSGNNTYSGATTISTGTLKMGSATGLSPNSTLTISGPGFLDINGNNVAMDGLLGTGTILNNGANDATLTAGAAGGSTSFGGVIADGTKAISLTKSGSGTLTLTGINTYSGNTTIANGTLSVANIGAGGNIGTGTNPIILGDATNKGTLSYTGTSDLTYTRGFTVNAGGGEINTTAVGKTLTLQGTDITAAGTFTVSGAGNAIVQSTITGSGGLTKANTGSMILSSVNTYSGNTTISTGTLQVTNAAAIPSGTGKGNVIDNGTLDVNNLSLTLNGLSGSGIVTNTAGSPVTLTVGGNDATAHFTGTIQDGSGVTSLVKTGTGIQTLGGSNTYSGDTTISSGTLQFGIATAIPSGSSKGNVALGSGGTLDLNDFDVSINGLSGSGLVTNNAGDSTLTVGNNNQTSTFSGNIQNGTGIIGLTKTGSGILTLSGNNTFSGATLIEQGTLSMGSDTGLSAASTLTIGNAGALDLNGKVIAIDGLAGTGSITNNSSTDVTLTIGSSGGSGTFGGTINDGTGVIGLVKTGSGTVTLSNVNRYSGHTTVTGGLLAITSYGALGEIPATVHPANIVLNGGGISAANTFVIDSKRGIAVGPATGSGVGILDAALNQTLTYNGILANNGSGTGGLTKTGLGTLSLGGSNTYSGDTTVSSGSLQIANAAAIPSGTGKGNLQLSATLDLNNNSILVNGLSGQGLVTNTKTGSVTLTAGGNDQTSTFGGVIENGNGTTALTKTGTGVLTLTGTNTFSGGTTISAGTLAVGSDANLGTVPNLATPANLVINAGATLTATSTFTLASNRGIAVGPSGAGIIDVASSQTLTYGGAIANNGGSGGFTKAGTGTLILTGNSTYTGTTTVESGVMTVNGNIGGSGATVVKTGATLNGTGTTGAMDVQSDGTLQPGDGGIGTLTVSGHLTLAGIANFELGTPGANHASPGTSDRVDVTGDVNYGGTINLIDNNNAGGLGSAGAGSYKLITYTGTSSGNFTGVTGLPKYHNAFHDVPADKALYIDLYDYAVATITPSVDLGRIHAGGTFGTQALTVGNTTAAGNFTESLGGVFGTTATGFTSSGSVTGIAGQSNNSSNMIVGISDNTAGQKTGLIGVNFTSQAVSSSGLANTALTSQNVTVNGFAYTGQSVWNIEGSGSWGNNVNAYGNWTHAGGVAGLDGILSVNDTATFGNATSGPSTVSLNGANPSLSGIRFDHDQSYTLALGTGGSLTFKGNGAAAVIADDNGNHTISAPMALASNANVSVAHASDTLTISGAISGSGNGITKSGDGTLALTGNSGYTGATLVSAGTLLVNGSLGNTSTTVASGATLAGNGTLGGDVTVHGNIAPGNPNEIGTIGVFSVYVDHMMSIDWNGTTNTIDQVNIQHGLQLGASSTIVFTGLGGELHDSAYVFATYDTFTGPVTQFGTVVDIPTGYTIDYAYGAGNNQLALVAIPEQGAALLGGLGMLFLLKRRRIGGRVCKG